MERAETPRHDHPRIYVACLAAYNVGRLHGVWINADQPPEDIYAAVSDMLAASPAPCAEDWAIHDYEGFGQLCLSEWECFERISAIAGETRRAPDGLDDEAEAEQ